MNKENAKDYLPLVQALAEGKTVQVMKPDGWEDVTGEIAFVFEADQYRIKRESREVWINVNGRGALSACHYDSIGEAEEGICPGWTPALFREVIE